MYGRVAVEAENAAERLSKSTLTPMKHAANYLRNNNAGELVDDAFDFGTSFLRDSPPPSLSKASVSGSFIAQRLENLNLIHRDN